MNWANGVSCDAGASPAQIAGRSLAKRVNFDLENLMFIRKEKVRGNGDPDAEIARYFATNHSQGWTWTVRRYTGPSRMHGLSWMLLEQKSTDIEQCWWALQKQVSYSGVLLVSTSKCRFIYFRHAKHENSCHFVTVTSEESTALLFYFEALVLTSSTHRWSRPSQNVEAGGDIAQLKIGADQLQILREEKSFQYRKEPSLVSYTCNLTWLIPARFRMSWNLREPVDIWHR